MCPVEGNSELSARMRASGALPAGTPGPRLQAGDHPGSGAGSGPNRVAEVKSGSTDQQVGERDRAPGLFPIGVDPCRSLGYFLVNGSTGIAAKTVSRYSRHFRARSGVLARWRPCSRSITVMEEI